MLVEDSLHLIQVRCRLVSPPSQSLQLPTDTTAAQPLVFSAVAVRHHFWRRHAWAYGVYPRLHYRLLTLCPGAY
jgi:hypothetical protein